ncbi:jg22589 [Pararge aegeria aegeria]|uniref:Jg22589 protein n=1 Tax=Pararge aegeria aegeria TaxID=348720 RepID=A0A8S4SLB9_9NEOP|nr:jg22589 [Pararge aegeria aegeria]
MWCWRRMLRIPWTAKRKHILILSQLKIKTRLSTICLQRILSYFGHITRRGNESIEKLIVVGYVEGKRPCGRSPTRWPDQLRETAAAVAVSLVEDGSSSSPPQAPLITQPLSDSDDPHLSIHKSTNLKSRHYCQIGNFESDSFNENFSPTRPANARRKRKYKKMPVDYADGKRSPPIEILSITTEEVPGSIPGRCNLETYNFFIYSGLVWWETLAVASYHPTDQDVPLSDLVLRNIFCGKRKWSHRDKGDGCEMRERSFSGGCTSKSAYFKNDIKSRKCDLEKKKKDTVLQPGKIVLQPQNLEEEKPCSLTSLPGSSSFNFVYKNTSKNGTPILSKLTGYRIATDLPPFFNPMCKNHLEAKYQRKIKILNKTHPPSSLRNPLLFDEANVGMDCTGNESSSLSSSDSDGVITNDSDREGDDELTDWPGIEELKVFNKSLTFKSSKSINNNCTKSVSNMPPPKRLKKEKPVVKSGWANCKNRFKKKRPKVDSGNEDDAMMSDSKTVVDVEDEILKEKEILPHSSFSTFGDIMNASASGQNADESFYQSFQAFQEKSEKEFGQTPRTNFTLQKTSSSDLNLSEKSPQSDHYYSEHSMNAGVAEVREIRAGCRRIREERPGFLILSAANEQLSKFLQDSCQTELKLSSFQDPMEKEKLESLAKLYSLELQVEMGRPILRKTSNTTQAIRVENYSSRNFPSDHKRRCYGDDADTSLSFSDPNSVTSANELDDSIPEVKSEADIAQELADSFSYAQVDKSLLHPGDLD